MKKTTNDFLVKTFLVFIIGAFVLFGISNFLIGMGRYNMIKVGNRSISIVKFSQMLSKARNSLYNSNIDKGDLDYINSPMFKQEILNQTIREELLNNEIYDLKLNTSNKTVAKILAKNDNFLDTEGNFDAVKFEDFLKRINLTEKEYIERFGEYLSKNTLINSLSETPLLTSSIIEKITNYENQIRRADIVSLNLKTIPMNITSPSVDEQRSYYEEYKDTFIIPETREISYVEIDMKNYTKNILITDKEIKEEYDNNKNTYKTVESRDLYYLATKDKNIAKVIKKELDAKKDVVELAKKYLNRDKKYVYIEDIKKGMIDRKLESQIEHLKPNEYTDVIENNGFYAIFYIVSVRPEKQLPLSEVKALIKKDLFNIQKEEITLDMVNKLEDLLLESENLENIARQFGLKINNLGYVNKDKLLSMDLFENDEARSLFEYQAGDLSNLILTNESKYKIFFVRDIKTKKTKEFDTVKNEIKKQIIENKRVELADEKIDEIITNLKHNNLTSISKKYNLKIQRNIEIKKDSKDYSQEFMDNLYALNNIKDISKVSRESEFAYKVSILRSIKKLKDGDEGFVSQAEIASKLNSSLQNSLFSNYYENYLKKKYKVSINEKMLNELE